jgi:hypothetical protein
MTAEARRVWCGLAVAVAGCLLATGCAWEVSPARSAEALETLTDGGLTGPDGGEARAERLTRREMDCDLSSDAKLVGPFTCGESFATRTRGECNDCADRGCTQSNEGVAECTCFGVAESCSSDPLSDAGDFVKCFSTGARCDCGDGLGRVYECDCEGQVSTPDECSCRVSSDDTFDYEFMCDQ